MFVNFPGNQGTTPRGTANPKEAARWVKQMFAAVAPRYDLLNHVLSFNIDKRWRKRLLERVGSVLQDARSVVLDLCCGTGDVTIDLEAATLGHVLGADFCHPMLLRARSKIAARQMAASVFEADAQQLPLRPESLDLITIAFGFRNLANYDAGLQEFRRVLKPGGLLAVLEFSHPANRAVRTSYGFYSKHVLPRVGAMVSGSAEAYRYLPESIERFPTAFALAERMTAAGFTEVTYELLSYGIAALHLGKNRPR
jgi:demethylmenaquinone methyltransferase / 2-methoxy-6-polyprenyl-1,4-benzoquinol methylase